MCRKFDESDVELKGSDYCGEEMLGFYTVLSFSKRSISRTFNFLLGEIAMCSF